tara:strand:+ start:247 stop:465 length:219 start_codon:yes stop_codon:yes gene_type:complete
MKNKNKIKIIINGKGQYIKSKSSIKDIVSQLKIPLNKVAIELNFKIVDKKRISKIFLNQKDKLEIVHFIGGG